MFKQKRLGNDGAGTARTDQFGDSSNQVDEQNCKIAHHAGIVTSGFRISKTDNVSQVMRKMGIRYTQVSDLGQIEEKEFDRVGAKQISRRR